MSGAATVLKPAPRRVRTAPDSVLGALGAAMVMLAVVVWLAGGPKDGATGTLVAPPVVELLEPADGSIVDGPLAVVFTSQVELAPQPGGWGVGEYHLHLRLGGLELMPGPADVVALPAGRYRWTVGALEPGTHRLQLYWSDARHAPVEGGESGVVEIEAR